VLVTLVLIVGLLMGGRGQSCAVRVAHYDPGLRSAGVVVSNTGDSVITFTCWLLNQNGHGPGTFHSLKPHEAIQLALHLPEDVPMISLLGMRTRERPVPTYYVYRMLEAVGIDTTTRFSVQVPLTNVGRWVVP
jgi:hypothetical protein